MISTAQIQVHMEVIDQAGLCLGHVDRLLPDGQLRLTRASPKTDGRNHNIPVDWVCALDDGRLRIDRSCAEAERRWTMLNT